MQALLTPALTKPVLKIRLTIYRSAFWKLRSLKLALVNNRDASDFDAGPYLSLHPK